MKENNKTKYLLGLILFGIWGLLGYRFYEKIHKESPFTLVNPIVTIDLPLQKDVLNYHLFLDYPDPFNKGKKIRQASKSKVLSTNLTFKSTLFSKSKISKKVNFPRVEYKGNIVNQQGKKTAIVKVDKEFLNLNIYQKYKDLEIIKIFQDSIIIRKEGAEKMIKRL